MQSLVASFFLLFWLQVSSHKYLHVERSRTILQKDICYGEAINLTETYEFTTHQRSLSASLPEDLGVPARRDAAGHPTIIRKMFDYAFLLTPNQLSRSLASQGDDLRTLRFAAKLVRGEAVKVVVLGGSVTAGMYPTLGPEENAWPAHFFRWIRDTFPHEDHFLVNRAIPATTTGYVGPCAPHSDLVPDDVDLVLIEFTQNDNGNERSRLWQDRLANKCNYDAIDTPDRRVVERLLRDLMRLPQLPTVMWVHTMRVKYTGGEEVKASDGDSPYKGVEDFYTTMFQYYGLPAVSQRNGMFQLYQQNPALLNETYKGDQHWIHPNCVGQRFLADMVVGYWMDQVAVASWSIRVDKHQQKNLPQWQLPAATVNFTLPEPMFEANFGDHPSKCVLPSSLRSYIVKNDGWEWTREGTEDHPKWGFVSREPGHELIIKVPVKDVMDSENPVVVGLGMLLSYSKDMGTAEVSCVQGCECQPHVFSTFVNESGWSMTFWKYMTGIEVVHSSEECHLKVVNSAKTASLGHKVKVSSFLVSSNPDVASNNDMYLEEIMADATKNTALNVTVTVRKTVNRHLL